MRVVEKQQRIYIKGDGMFLSFWLSASSSTEVVLDE